MRYLLRLLYSIDVQAKLLLDIRVHSFQIRCRKNPSFPQCILCLLQGRQELAAVSTLESPTAPPPRHARTSSFCKGHPTTKGLPSQGGDSSAVALVTLIPAAFHPSSAPKSIFHLGAKIKSSPLLRATLLLK